MPSSVPHASSQSLATLRRKVGPPRSWRRSRPPSLSSLSLAAPPLKPISRGDCPPLQAWYSVPAGKGSSDAIRSASPSPL
ncbi:hypothetical protein PC116_g24102 [Phytophthora cactorum]|nr:hypothetical protein PC116_g24102 [Phytophthora cactorum]